MEYKRCEKCRYWKKDYGLWCMNGWSGMDRDDGHCHIEPVKIGKKAGDFCSYYESSEKPKDSPDGKE